MKNIMKKVVCFIMIFALALCIPVIGSTVEAQAAASNWFKFTGKPKLVEEPSPHTIGDEFSEKVDFTPTLKKDSKTGVYTLTVYDRSKVVLKTTRSNKNYKVVRVNEPEFPDINVFGNYNDGSVEMDIYHGWFEEGKNTYTEVVKLKLQDLRVYSNNKKKTSNKNYGKYYGSTVTLKVVVKKLPLTVDQQYTKQAEERFEEIRKEINASQYDTELEKAGAIFEWIVVNVKPDHLYDYQDWRDAVVAGYTVCEGYSDLFAMLCTAEGLKCETVQNDTHQWNLIVIDGRWYWTDTTPGRALGFESIVGLPDNNDSLIAIKERVKEEGGEIGTEFISWLDLPTWESIVFK